MGRPFRGRGSLPIGCAGIGASAASTATAARSDPASAIGRCWSSRSPATSRASRAVTMVSALGILSVTKRRIAAITCSRRQGRMLGPASQPRLRGWRRYGVARPFKFSAHFSSEG